MRIGRKKFNVLMLLILSIIFLAVLPSSNFSDIKSIPSQALIENDIIYLAFGDSLAQGYPYNLKKEPSSYSDFIFKELKITLETSNNKIYYMNYGTSGFTSSDLFAQISDTKIAKQVSKANIITLNIGGNDMLNTFNKHNLSSYKLILTSIDAYLDNLDKIFAKLRTVNPNANIYMANIFNPSAPNNKAIDYNSANLLILYINQGIKKASSSYNINVIDVNSVFKGHEYNSADSWFYDKIHPNKNGYLEMSKPFTKKILNDLVFNVK